MKHRFACSRCAGLALIVLTLTACGRKADLGAYHGPPFTVEATARRVTIETVVHSGGYALSFDHAQIEGSDLDVYMTLDAPNMQSLVMEAPQTLTKSFANRADAAKSVRVWVRITTPDQSVTTAPYRVATKGHVDSQQ